MRRVGNLWPALIDKENLYRAAVRSLRGKRKQVEACDFFESLESNLETLKIDLENSEYVPGRYRSFWIREPKPRLISAAPFRDRVVHHALINVIEPVYERRFIHHSYACRKGKGNHRALQQFVEWGRNSKYVLKMDIRKFFPSIDHEILKAELRRTIKDPQVLWLCDLIIDNSNPQEMVPQWFCGDDLLAPAMRKKGIPIGNLTSQFFGNVYLNSLDHLVKEKLRARKYLRYVDDFAIFGDSKPLLQEIRAAVAAYLSRYRLKLNDGKSRIRQLKEGIEFLGFVCLPDRLRLSSSNVCAVRKRLPKLTHDLVAGNISLNRVRASFQAWEVHAATGNTWRLRQDIGHSVSASWQV